MQRAGESPAAEAKKIGEKLVKESPRMVELTKTASDAEWALVNYLNWTELARQFRENEFLILADYWDEQAELAYSRYKQEKQKEVASD